jgi:hypothetical protein
MTTNSAQDDYQSEASMTHQLTSDSGDQIVVAIGPTGRTVLKNEALDKRAVLSSIVVTGLTPEQVAQKSGGFWGKLWDKIKDVVNDVIDAVTDATTFDAGPFNCRASVNVDYQSERDYTVTVQLNCRD